MLRCPGQDRRFWRPIDIFEMSCPYCGQKIEFWKDDPRRECLNCGKVVRNPQMNLGCAQWCQYAAECLGTLPDRGEIALPLEEQLKGVLYQQVRTQPERLQQAIAVVTWAETLMTVEGGDPAVIKPAALLLGVMLRIKENNHAAIDVLKDDSFKEPLDWKAVLEQAGVESDRIAKVGEVVANMLAGKPQPTLEFAIVWDALHLTRFSFLRSAESSSWNNTACVNLLKTRSGKQIAVQDKNVSFFP